MRKLIIALAVAAPLTTSIAAFAEEPVAAPAEQATEATAAKPTKPAPKPRRPKTPKAPKTEAPKTETK